MQIKALDPAAGQVALTNEFAFTNLNVLTAHWEVTADGRPLQSGMLPPLDLPPGHSQTISIPLAVPDPRPGGEIFLTLRLRLAGDTPWADAGHEIAAAQFPLPSPTPAASAPPNLVDLPELTLQQTADTAAISGADFQLIYDKSRGRISAWQKNGVDLITSGPALNVWRAPTDNDGIKLDDERYHLLDEWLKAGLHELRYDVDEVTLEQPAPQKIIIRSRGRAGTDTAPDTLEYAQTLTIFGHGELLLENQVVTHHGLPPLPRIGLTMALPAGFEKLSWFGRGPFENYRDRSSGALVGRYHSTVGEQYVPYIVPQEHGNKTDVRWAALTNDEGAGLLAIGAPLLEISAGHFTADDLYTAAHTHELTPRAETILNLDLMQMGLGTASCGPATLPDYLIVPGTYSFSVRLRPFSASETDPATLARTPVPADSP